MLSGTYKPFMLSVVMLIGVAPKRDNVHLTTKNLEKLQFFFQKKKLVSLKNWNDVG